MNVDPRRLSTLAWITKDKIKNEKGEQVEFANHGFMLDPYTDDADILVIRKASQIGASLMQTLRLLHAAKFHGINQAYTLPTDTDRNDFVKSKVNPIIENNPGIKKGVVGSYQSSVETKQIGRAWIYFRGTWTERSGIMITTERNMHDELDFSKASVIEQFETRQGAQPRLDIKYFSTPTIPDYGIDKKWGRSDQKHWRFTCPHCKHRQYMTWDNNVDLERRCYMCSKCHNKITVQDIARGKWEAKYPGRPISGYWISQLICPWITPERIITDYDNAQAEGDLGIFYNFKLGMPYVASDAQIPEGYILRNIQPVEDADLKGRNMMGVDTGGGKGHHVTIGNEKGIFYMATLKDRKDSTRWQQLERLIVQFEIKVCVIDGMPYTEEAFDLAKKYPYKVFLAWFNDDLKDMQIVKYEDESRSKEARRRDFKDKARVFIARTRMIDHLVSVLRQSKLPIALERNTTGVQEFISHARAMFARDVEDRYKQIKREWSNTGAIDRVMSVIYFLAARMKEGHYDKNK